MKIFITDIESAIALSKVIGSKLVTNEELEKVSAEYIVANKVKIINRKNFVPRIGDLIVMDFKNSHKRLEIIDIHVMFGKDEENDFIIATGKWIIFEAGQRKICFDENT